MSRGKMLLFKKLYQNHYTYITGKIVSKKRLLAGVPDHLSELDEAVEIQRIAAGVGFDWNDPEDVLKKIEEEIQEVKEAHDRKNVQELEEELGDLAFALVNLCRFYDIKPERAVKKANKKFMERFSHVEDQVNESGKPWSQFSLDELDVFWDQAKALAKKTIEGR